MCMIINYLQDVAIGMNRMVLFNSLIALDLETTSLPSLDHRTTKITELAFIGCEIKHITDSEELPRVLHKLVLLFNPLKRVNENITGITNELLENLSPFRVGDAKVLEHFITRLPQPVCIVAHNGKQFDFPILKRALEKVNSNFPDNVYCADSLQGFKSLLPKVQKRRGSYKEITTPPKAARTIPQNSLNYKVSRELFPEHDALSEWVSTQEIPDSPSTSFASPRSYKLKDIYYFLRNSYFPLAHTAEADAKALLESIIRCKDFLDWMNESAVPFNTIQALF